ncbi:MAG: protein translocase subunit SecD, partial [Phaeovulum sp.]|nr:protein translocase subunit SecD [Phaeovulum sp.]
MLQIPSWKRILILAVCLFGIVSAAPNLFYGRVEAHNDAIAASEKAGFETEAQAAARAAWSDWLPSGLVNLGLDLRGGAHLLAEVQLADVYKARMDALWPELRKALADERATVGAVRRAPSDPGVLRVQIGEPAAMTRALEIAASLATPVVSLTGIGQNDLAISAEGD